MSNFKKKHPAGAYVRDVHLAYLIKGARRTKGEGYPIIEGWMIAKHPPEDIFQWDKRNEVTDPANTAMSFYCNDVGFTPILNNPQKYVEKLKKYQCVIGLDASPYDNMPPVVQKSQIFCNLAVTDYFGTQGIKVVPNVRLGSEETLDSLDAYPKHHLIAIGTNGFTWSLANRVIFKNQVDLVVKELAPSGILVYGPASDYIFEYAKQQGVQIYQYDSFTMKRNMQRKVLSKERDKGER